MQNDNDDRLEKRMDEIIVSSSKENEDNKKTQEEKSLPQAELLVSLVTKENCELFHDQFHEPCAHILVKDHWENHKMKSKKFKHWLSRLLWDESGKAANATALQSALAILEGKAIFDGTLHHLYTRVAKQGEIFWYDLANEKGQAIKVTSDDWEVVDHPPILFCRYPHQLPQVVPIKADIKDIKKLEDFINLAKSEYTLLFQVYLITCFIPDIPHPIPIVFGSKGSAKSTFAKILSKLIDPSIQGVSGMPTDQNEIVRQLYHHWFRFFDNITSFSTSTSDLLCRAVTGDGFSKRALFSDDDDVIFSFKHCIGLNGINNCAQKPDLLDRAILFRLEPIPDEKRRSEDELWEDFAKIRAVILGGIFAILSKAMRLKREQPKLKNLPRMADFTVWGCAIAQAMGSSQEAFLSVYHANLNEQNEEAIQENPVALAIVYFMDNKVEWENTASELLGELNKIADNEKLNAKGNAWPKSAAALTRKINEVKTNLAQKGILIDTHKGPHGKRSLSIRNIPKDIADSATLELIDRVRSVFGGDVKVKPENIPPHDNSEPPVPDESSGDSGDIPQQLF